MQKILKQKKVLTCYTQLTAELEKAVTACHLQEGLIGSVRALEASHGNPHIYCMLLKWFYPVFNLYCYLMPGPEWRLI